MHYLRNKSAFTLLEIMIAMVVFSIISVALMFMVNSMSAASKTLASDSEIMENARIALSFISEEMRMCDEFELVAAGEDSFLKPRFSYDSPNKYFGLLATIKFKRFTNRNFNSYNIRVFRYLAEKGTNKEYFRLDYGGNDYNSYRVQELAGHIINIYVETDPKTKLLTLKMTLKDGRGRIDSEPFIISKVMSYKYKATAPIGNTLIDEGI